MKISFTFKNFDPSPHLKGYAQKRFEKLGRKFVSGIDNAELQVNLLVDKFRHKADVILNADTIHISAMESSEDMYSTIDLVLDKLQAQLIKQREKMKGITKKDRASSVRMETLSFGDLAEGGGTPTIIGTDEYQPKPMSVEEAAMQLETFSNEFLVFRNAETEGINVIYKRKNGDYGLIDPGT